MHAPWTDKSVWVFDLDNTLYPAECNLFAQIDQRMTAFVSRFLNVDAAQARQVQKAYLVEHGTTLNGLMARHGLAPGEFLDFVHDIDLAPVSPDPLLAETIAALPGRKLIFTNGSRRHGERVAAKLGLDGLFEDIFDIAASGYAPKPTSASYERLLQRHGFDPHRAVLFEDLTRNLAPAAAMGFTTVLVRSAKDWSHEPEAVRPAGAEPAPDYVHYSTDHLAGFLRALQKD
ncbi:MAG: pyrimidine 5'-nucleotidase [Hyphomonadaceae bacterium]